MKQITQWWRSFKAPGITAGKLRRSEYTSGFRMSTHLWYLGTFSPLRCDSRISWHFLNPFICLRRWLDSVFCIHTTQMHNSHRWANTPGKASQVGHEDAWTWKTPASFWPGEIGYNSRKTWNRGEWFRCHPQSAAEDLVLSGSLFLNAARTSSSKLV